MGRLGFIKMQSTIRVAIKGAIKSELETMGLSFENLQGQGYDGGTNMSGENKGVQSLISNYLCMFYFFRHYIYYL